MSEHYKPLESGEGIGSYASKVAAAGLGPLPNPRLVVEYHPLVREALTPWIHLRCTHAAFWIPTTDSG